MQTQPWENPQASSKKFQPKDLKSSEFSLAVEGSDKYSSVSESFEDFTTQFIFVSNL